MKKTEKTESTKPVSRGRHEKNCGICKHEDRESIERDFVAWRSPATIAEEYKLSNRATVYRHAHALGLFAKRQRNIRAALERIIEKSDDVEVTAGAVVQAVTAYARINAEGRLVERSERIDLNVLFEKMSQEELESYARDGVLPQWFAQTVGATLPDSQESENDE